MGEGSVARAKSREGGKERKEEGDLDKKRREEVVVSYRV